MRIKYHGNWCGPGWSDGDWVDSRKGYAPAIDEFDETCRQHDFSLAGGVRDRGADRKFVDSNMGKGPKRTLAAIAVATRDYIQTLTDKPQTQIKMTKTKNQKKFTRYV